MTTIVRILTVMKPEHEKAMPAAKGDIGDITGDAKENLLGGTMYSGDEGRSRFL
jgi:hypothetical protein